MHVFEAPLGHNPTMIILFDDRAVVDLLLAAIIDTAPADDLGEQRKNWAQRSSAAPWRRTPGSIRGGLLHMAQAMTAERRSPAGLTFREILRIAYELGDELMLPGFAEPYPQLVMALTEFVQAIPTADDEHPNAGIKWDAPTKVTADKLIATFDRAAQECVAGGELQTMDELQIFIDCFLANLIRAI